MTIVSVGSTGLGDIQWKVEFSDSFSFGQGKPPKIWIRGPNKTNEFLHQNTKVARTVAASEGKLPFKDHVRGTGQFLDQSKQLWLLALERRYVSTKSPSGIKKEIGN